MFSAINTKLLIAIVLLLATIASYFAYQKREQEAERQKIFRQLRPDEKHAQAGATKWAQPIQNEKLK